MEKSIALQQPQAYTEKAMLKDTLADIRPPRQGGRMSWSQTCVCLALLILTTLCVAQAGGYGSPAFAPVQKEDKLAERHDQAWPALMRAAWAGDIAAVKAELKAGADVNARSNTGTTALLAATMKSHDEIVEFLLAHNADVDGRNMPRNTPLMVAARNGDVAIARLLLRHGADIHATNKKGESPYSIARALGNKEILALFQGIRA